MDNELAAKMVCVRDEKAAVSLEFLTVVRLVYIKAFYLVVC